MVSKRQTDQATVYINTYQRERERERERETSGWSSNNNTHWRDNNAAYLRYSLSLFPAVPAALSPSVFSLSAEASVLGPEGVSRPQRLNKPLDVLGISLMLMSMSDGCVGCECCWTEEEEEEGKADGEDEEVSKRYSPTIGMT